MFSKSLIVVALALFCQAGAQFSIGLGGGYGSMLDAASNMAAEYGFGAGAQGRPQGGMGGRRPSRYEAALNIASQISRYPALAASAALDTASKFAAGVAEIPTNAAAYITGNRPGARPGAGANMGMGFGAGGRPGAGANMGIGFGAGGRPGAHMEAGMGGRPGMGANAEYGIGLGGRPGAHAQYGVSAGMGGRPGMGANAEYGIGLGGRPGVQAQYGVNAGMGGRPGMGANAEYGIGLGGRPGAHAQYGVSAGMGGRPGMGANAEYGIGLGGRPGAQAQYGVSAGGRPSVGVQVGAGAQPEAHVETQGIFEKPAVEIPADAHISTDGLVAPQKPQTLPVVQVSPTPA